MSQIGDSWKNKLHDESCMQYVENFHVTKQVKEMQRVYESRDEINSMILEGIAGSGKTQAAQYFISTIKSEYDIIAKIVATDERTVLNSLKRLCFMLELPLRIESREEIIGPETLCNRIKIILDDKYLKYSCLFLIDDATLQFPYTFLLSLLSNTKKRYGIITTSDKDVKISLCSSLVIEFNGMDTNECYKFLKKNDQSVVFSDVKKLKEKTGNLPIVVYSAGQYISLTGQTLATYVSSLKNPKSEQILTNLSEQTDVLPGIYGKTIIKSQLLPLFQIKDKLQKRDEKLWKVMEFIPFLCCESIATTVLEACYFHISTCESKCKAQKINFLISVCRQFSMCQIGHMKKSAFRDSIEYNRSRSSEESKIRLLSFHEITIVALSSLCKETKKYSENIVLELLKILCYEIDIDARTDITIQRNMLFISHAKKLLTAYEGILSNKEQNEISFFLAYLHCAIGSTLLFQRIDIESAHIHLVKARSKCLKIVGDKSLFDRNTCPYIMRENKSKLQHPKIIKDAIKNAANLVMGKKLDKRVVQQFLIHKRRSENDLETLKAENVQDFHHRNCHYITLDEYHILQNHKLALPLDQICETMFSEFFLRILINNGRALNELRYIKNDEDEHLKNASYFEFTTANEFCILLKEKLSGFLFFVCLENDRTGRMLTRFSDYVEKNTDIDIDVKFYENMIKEPFEFCFNFGILKMSKMTNDRHVCMCCRILIRLLHLKFTQLEDKGKETYSVLNKGKEYADKLLNKIKEIETGKNNRNFKWISLPLLYLQCAKFYSLSSIQKETEYALSLFQKTIDLEESREVIWSRFMHEGYYGCLVCFKYLRRGSEGSQLLKKIKSKLDGAKMENVYHKLEKLKYDR